MGKKKEKKLEEEGFEPLDSWDDEAEGSLLFSETESL